MARRQTGGSWAISFVYTHSTCPAYNSGTNPHIRTGYTQALTLPHRPIHTHTPQMILRRGYGKAVDWWSMGALTYEMVAGYPPFRGKTTKELNRRILNDRVALPQWLSAGAHSVIRGFLERDVGKRLGATRGTMFEVGGVTAVK